jgi:MarR family transcriptional regulator, transcriptional regulator for hemolysin
MVGRYGRGVLGSADEREGAVPSMGELGLNHFAPYLLNRIAARWNADLSEELKAFDMTTAKMRVLAILSVSSGLAINELSVYAVTEQSTMSRTLDAMEEQGLVRRSPRADDARVRETHITEKGTAAFAAIWPMMVERFRHMFEGVSESEYQTFVATLHRILGNIRRHDI